MSNLEMLLAQSKANAGAMPPVNPPQAQAVLETKTAAEVAGEPVADLPPAAVPAPVPKPPEVVAAEATPKTRRTAAVVQAELDAAMAENGELHKRIGELARHSADPKALDAAKAQVNVLTEHLSSAEVANEKAAVFIRDLQAQLQAGAGTVDVNNQDLGSLCSAIADLGFTATLTYKGGL